MTSPRSCLLAIVLATLVSALVAPLPRGERTASPRVRHDRPGEAIAFRNLSLRDEQGTIKVGGLMEARRHLKAMKQRRGRVHGVPEYKEAVVGAPAAGTTETSSASAQAGIALANGSWTSIGPGNVGGRVRTLLVHPTKHDTMFVGSVSGGIWKTTNGGGRWAPIDDFMANLAVTSLVMQPGNPQVLYAATGEGFGNADAIRGAGIFKSTDGGGSWTQLPSTATSPFWYVNRLAMSADGKTLLAATRSGIYRSVDGGATFVRTLSVPMLDLDFHPSDSRRAVAGDGNNQVWYSTDGGAGWIASGGMLSVGGGRVEITYARGTPNLVYAAANINGGVIYRSVDGGVSFAIAYDGARTLFENGQGWYDNVIWVNPFDDTDLIVGGVSLFRSRDGGSSWTPISEMYGTLIHPDHHVIVEHPAFNNVSNRVLFFGNDGGVWKADLANLNNTSTARYQELNNELAITQFYGAAGNPSTGVIVGGTQDNGTLTFTPTWGSEGWLPMFGGDGGFAAADPDNPNYFYGEYVYLQLHRSTNGGVSAQWMYNGLDDAGTRANFIAPFILDPNNSRRLLAGGESLWVTDDARAPAPSWRNIKRGANYNYISAIAVASGNGNVVWVGHNNGDLYRTSNGLAATPVWTRVDPTAFPNRFITRITISPFDPNVVYVAFGGFADGNIQKTINGGASWGDATGTGTTGLPLAPVRDVEIDPSNPNVIWAGTEVGIFTSGDGGSTWDPTQDGPANVSVDELFVLGDFLVAATHGRGLFRHPLSGSAGTPGFSTVPTAVAFSSMYVGQPQPPKTVRVVNSGTGGLAINGASIAGTHAGDFSIAADDCTGRTIQPAAACGISVSFTPKAIGSRSASLVVVTNAHGSPHTVSLSGDGLMPPAQPLPAPWASADIGRVGVPGGAAPTTGGFRVTGAGRDVWDTADAFHYAYTPVTGNAQIVARVSSIEAVASWTKAGVMIRHTLQPESAHAFMLVSAGKGFAFQRRPAAGALSAHTSGGAGTAPAWVRLMRTGNTIEASVSSNGTAWTVVGRETIALPDTVYFGLAVSSHSDARTATALFDQVSISPLASGSKLPAGWLSRDVGSVGTAGAASESAGTFSLKGAGADIWGTADAFHFAYRSLSGDGAIVARVASIQGTQAWTKMGVMIRESLGPGSAHAFMLVSVAKGLAFQRRTTNGGISTHTSGGSGTAPKWVKLARMGNIIAASVSADGVSWSPVGSDTFSMPSTVYVGLAAHSHDPAVAATAAFDGVSVTTGSLPAGWQNTDIGSVGVPGAASASATAFSIKGAGADIWGTADALHYAYRTLAGDGDVVARVTTAAGPHAWTKVGVMLRESLDADAAHAFMLVSTGKGVAFQRRVAARGQSTHTGGAAASPPQWVKLSRRGSVVTGFVSTNGTQWTEVGRDTFAFPGAVHAGLAISSHDPARLAEATVTNVQVTNR